MWYLLPPFKWFKRPTLRVYKLPIEKFDVMCQGNKLMVGKTGFLSGLWDAVGLEFPILCFADVEGKA